MRRRRRGQDRPAEPRRDPDLRAWPGGIGRALPRAAALRHRAGAGARARAAAVRRRRHAADLLRRRRPVRGPRGRRRDAGLRPPRAGDEVDGPGRHRRVDQADLRRARQVRLRVRLLSRVPQGGLGAGGLPQARPGRDRRRRQLGRRRRRRALRAARRAARAHRRRHRPRWSSSPPTRSWRRRSRSSTRSPTSARRPAPTCSRSPGGWASTSGSASTSCAPGLDSAARCFAPEETVLVRHRGRTTLLSLERLWERIGSEQDEYEDGRARAS